MKFFLDENFPKTVASILEEMGHEVFDIRSTEFEGSDDNLIFQMAQDKKAIFLTTDKDFFHTIPSLYETHYGIVVIVIRKPNRSSIMEKFLFALNHVDLSSFKSKILVLRDNNYSIFGE